MVALALPFALPLLILALLLMVIDLAGVQSDLPCNGVYFALWGVCLLPQSSPASGQSLKHCGKLWARMPLDSLLLVLLVVVACCCCCLLLLLLVACCCLRLFVACCCLLLLLLLVAACCPHRPLGCDFVMGCHLDLLFCRLL